MTNIDKRIKELNEKLGRKTGVDFKKSAKVIGKEIYENKPVFYGMVVSNGLFIFTGLGFVVCTVAGVATYFGTKKFRKLEKEGKKE